MCHVPKLQRERVKHQKLVGPIGICKTRIWREENVTLCVHAQ